MAACCSPFSSAADRQFDAGHAKADLARYRKKGPDPTTRALLDGLRPRVEAGSSVLDVGAGIGVLAFELLPHTQGLVTLVDASAGFTQTARDEAGRRGISQSVTVALGDFLELAPEIAPADVVTMDRVVCCYPSAEPLLDAAVTHARRWFAYSYPRDRWFVRAAVAFENFVRRLRGNPFRSYVHSPAAMRAVVSGLGFQLCFTRDTTTWATEVWER